MTRSTSSEAPSCDRRPEEPEPEVLLDGELAEDPSPLRDERDAAPRDGLRRPPAQRATVQLDVAARGPDETHDRVQGRRLSRAVRADEPDDLPGPDLERDAANGGDPAVAHLEVGDDEAGRAQDGPSWTALSPR